MDMNILNKTMQTLLFSGLVLPVVMALCHKHQHNHEDASVKVSLQLNNGQKWPSDAPTHLGMQNLKKIVKAGTGDKIASGPGQLAALLETETGNILKACKMEGKAHEELHKLIGKFYVDYKTMNGADADKAKKAVADFQKHLGLYSKFFSMEEK